MKIVSSAENSSLDWKAQYKYIEDIDDGRGYTAGIIGFCSGTGDMLDLVELLHRPQAGQRARQVPARPARGRRHRLARRSRPELHRGLEDRGRRHRLQDRPERRARPGLLQPVRCTRARPTASAPSASSSTTTPSSCTAPAATPPASATSASAPSTKAKPPSQGGNETTYLNAFLDARVWAMKQEEAHSDTSRVDTAQRVFLTQRQPQPRHPPRLEGLRRQLPHQLATTTPPTSRPPSPLPPTHPIAAPTSPPTTEGAREAGWGDSTVKHRQPIRTKDKAMLSGPRTPALGAVNKAMARPRRPVRSPNLSGVPRTCPGSGPRTRPVVGTSDT